MLGGRIRICSAGISSATTVPIFVPSLAFSVATRSRYARASSRHMLHSHASGAGPSPECAVWSTRRRVSDEPNARATAIACGSTLSPNEDPSRHTAMRRRSVPSVRAAARFQQPLAGPPCGE